jgi:DNA polymerase
VTISNDSTRYLILDYETYSELDLKKVGGWEYSKHHSTEILCVGYRFGTRANLANSKTVIWSPYLPETQIEFRGFLEALRNSNVQLVAHNALFEQVLTKNVFGPRYMRSKLELRQIPLERWICTASLSRSRGLPGKLEDVTNALNLSHKKDMEGHRLMLRLCKPKKPSKKDPSLRINDEASIARLAEYCVRDVDAETELFLRLPPLHPREREFWLIDQAINLRGFGVDRNLVQSALTLIAHETNRLDEEVRTITKGRLNSARQRNAVLKYLRVNKMVLPDLRANTVKEVLEKNEFPNEQCQKLLEARDAISRSSTSKYRAFEMRSRSDSRARDNTIFFGAHTGRQAGTGLQPQNLFKTLFRPEDLGIGLGLILANDRHCIEALFEKPMELYASALRSCIVPSPESFLDVGDFATIEVRVLFWLAGNDAGLQAFKAGQDLYIEMAAKIYGVCPKELKRKYDLGDKKASLMRQLGKQTVLGAGFGMGINGEKFQATCKQYGIDIPISLAKRAIQAYRQLHQSIPVFWSNLERAALLAFTNPGKTYRIGFLKWKMEKDFLTVELPIGRKLSYYQPKVELKKNLYGFRRQLSYMGILSPSKKFGRIKTWGGKLAENVVQAVARDLLMEAVSRLEMTESKPVLTVHDEIICERPEGQGSFEEFLKTMAMVPDWAKGFPIKVEGWSEKRYRK